MSNLGRTGRKGRSITEKDISSAKQMAAVGCTDKQIFCALGVSKDYFYRKKKEHKDFNDAIDQARAKGIVQIANAQFQSALSGDVRAQQFILSRRGGWIDESQQKPSESENLAIAITSLVDRLEGA